MRASCEKEGQWGGVKGSGKRGRANKKQKRRATHRLPHRGVQNNVVVRGAAQLHQLRRVARHGKGAAKGRARDETIRQVKVKRPAHRVVHAVLPHKTIAKQLPIN
jgi:hypothetical protein